MTDVGLEPLAVAKLLAAIVRREEPELVVMGKQAIDDDMNATGQMLAALLLVGRRARSPPSSRSPTATATVTARG